MIDRLVKTPNKRRLFHPRKGWSVTEDIPGNKNLIESYVLKGAKYLIVNKNSFHKEVNYPKIYSDPHYSVYKLEPK